MFSAHPAKIAPDGSSRRKLSSRCTMYDFAAEHNNPGNKSRPSSSGPSKFVGTTIRIRIPARRMPRRETMLTRYPAAQRLRKSSTSGWILSRWLSRSLSR